MADAPTLYSPALLAHARDPHCAGTLPEPTHTATVDNPLCGDRIKLHLHISQGGLVAVAHRTRGCALCVASASVMARQLHGQPLSIGQAALKTVQADLTPDAALSNHPILSVFDGLRAAPARLRCVALPWTALAEALGEAP